MEEDMPMIQHEEELPPPGQTRNNVIKNSRQENTYPKNDGKSKGRGRPRKIDTSSIPVAV
jgi:hypothetical protein